MHESRTKKFGCIYQSGVEESLAAITGAWLFVLEENSGEVVAAYLLPHHLFLYVIYFI